MISAFGVDHGEVVEKIWRPPMWAGGHGPGRVIPPATQLPFGPGRSFVRGMRGKKEPRVGAKRKEAYFEGMRVRSDVSRNLDRP